MHEILNTGWCLRTSQLIRLFGETEGVSANERICWKRHCFSPVAVWFLGFSINITDGYNQWKLLECQVLSSVIINDFARSVQCKVIAYISLQFLFSVKCTCTDGYFIHECLTACMSAWFFFFSSRVAYILLLSSCVNNIAVLYLLKLAHWQPIKQDLRVL